MIYDCFSFYNELDLLEIRFRELDAVVDRFVVAEATVTHAGRPKPLYFAESAARFAAWRDKIIHIVVDDMPVGPDPWTRERHQRDAIARGLSSAVAGDVVMVSDCDEIPSADAVRRWTHADGPRAFEQISSYYWINCVGGLWAGSRILSLEQFRRYPAATAIRFAQFPALPNGGWHFSFVGGTEKIVAKLEAYAHQDLNLDRFKDLGYLRQVTTLGIDIFGREDVRWRFTPVDERFPSAVREHRERFSHLLCEAAFHEEWYPDDQLLRAVAAYERVRALVGIVVEIGSWEGKSTVALANACHPEELLAVDTWAGSVDESPHHASVHLARERDVFAQFQKNVALLTRGNVTPVRRDCHDFLADAGRPIKFVHIDASHDYASVRRTIDGCLRRLVPGGLLCGDDFLTANAGRTDLDGGVERAVRERLPGFEQIHNFWMWQRPLGGAR
jgi:beta-1,4-mannosyl-glycoprotein beta-1,4-N-acetylglucosaminyltransferase